MAKPSRSIPLPLQRLEVAHNKMIAQSAGSHLIARRINHAVAFRRKGLVSKAMDLANLQAATTGTHKPWRFYVRTGDGDQTNMRMIFDVLLMPPASISGGRVLFEVKEVGGAAVDSYTIHDHRIGSEIPDEIRRQIVGVAVSSNTEYEITCEAWDGAKPFAVAIFEYHPQVFSVPLVSNAAAVNTEPYSYGNNIVHEREEELDAAIHALWKHNGSHMIAWCTDWDPDQGFTAPTLTSATAANALDTSVSVVSDTSPGFFIPTEYDRPYHSAASNGVECTFAAYAKDAGAGNGVVELYRSDGAGGNTLIKQLTGFSTGGGWVSGSCTIDAASLDKVDVYIAGDGTNAITLYAVSLFPYIS